MSKNKMPYRKKGTNNNKPLRREWEREREEREKGFGNGAEGGQTSSSHYKGRHPPELKGKAIGLWYRNQQAKVKKEEPQPIAVALNQDLQDEIQHVVSTVDSAVKKATENFTMKGTFEQTFLNKINVTFEEKLEKANYEGIKKDPQVNEDLFNELNKKVDHSNELKKMLEFRQKLPAYGKLKEIIDLIQGNQITLVSGETGCGKTTQVVQFLLDHYILKKEGSLFNAICTQPRRISAISVTERVAAERAERVGESVGYMIRLENVLPKRNRGTITFVTTGILIQRLQSDPTLSGISHLIIDEIHERNTICDFLITLLKYILPKRKDLKVVLMSATLNAKSFSQYFGGVPCIDIPGFTYPVEEHYLEDILKMVPFRFPEGHSNMKWKANKNPVFYSTVLPLIKDLEKTGTVPQSVINQLKNPESESMNLDLIADLIYYICTNEPEGAILVFVPGLSAIKDLNMILSKRRFFSSRALIIPMHSILPTVNQRKVFDTPPNGIRKIIISTSISETSITIDDVVYVIDSGRYKAHSFDVKCNVSMLEPEWESLANVKQRAGRAGRTRPGKCYRLFTKARESTFEQFPTPEMKRTRLEEVVLNAKVLQLGRVQPFLEKLMDPPDPEAVTLSLKMLRTLNLLDSEERLTPLGFHLAKLPLDPQTSKMILMAALFGCLDPILSVACCLSFKDPFYFVLGKEEIIQEKRYLFSRGEKSDHYMFSEAVRLWEEAYDGGFGSDFAYENFLSQHNLVLLRNMKRQFAKLLFDMKFLRSSDPKDPRSNVNSENIDLIKAVVCSGLYPNVAMLKNTGKQKSGGAHVKWKTVDNPKVEISQKSVLGNEKYFESSFIVYYEKMKSVSGIFLYDATMVHPMALLLFGERFDVVQEGDQYYVRVDDLIKFRCPKKLAFLLQKLRNHFYWVLNSVTTNPEVIDWKSENTKTLILKGIVDLISSGNSMTSESWY